MKYSIIKKSEIEGSHRIDAEYYKPFYLDLVYRLKNIGAKPLKEIGELKREPFKPSNKSEEYFQYIEISEINLVTGEYLSKNIKEFNAPSRARYKLKKGDLIISTVRPSRNAVSLISENNKSLVCSSGFAAINSSSDIPTEYLFVYFKTDPIKKLLARSVTATMYPAVTYRDILNIPVLIPDSEVINRIKKDIKKFNKLLDNSKKLYQEAEDLLLEELDLKDYQPKDRLIYTVNLKDVKSACRMDAEYFQPKYSEIIKQIENNSEKLLKNVDEVKANFNIDQKPEKKFRYIELSNISSEIGVVEGGEIITSFSAPSRAKRKLKKGDVIISSVAGSSDKVALIDDEHKGSIASTGFFQFRPKNDINSESLLVLAKSVVIQSQLEKETSGTILSAVPIKSLKNIIIPLISQKAQKKIASFVRESHESRKKAKDLLEQVKNKVERLIEEGQ
jgi:type I restriction enzyme S subunit/type I restriction enzyme M protein